jgi:hypothetical protein
MKQIFASLVLIAIWGVPALASHPQPITAAQAVEQATGQVTSSPVALFRQHIPFVAEQFIGMPVKMGGLPARTGTTDNSSLFFSIYAASAKKAGLIYKAWLPMRYLLDNTFAVPEAKVENGDLIVLENGLAAMIYKKEPSGRLYMLYASEKRQHVTSFHSENLVYQAYWQEHLKGFYRLKPEMLRPAR